MCFPIWFSTLLMAEPQGMMGREGIILPVVLNETISTARLQDNDPILFSLADDVRAAGHRGPILIPRGSNVVARVVKSQRAGADLRPAASPASRASVCPVRLRCRGGTSKGLEKTRR